MRRQLSTLADTVAEMEAVTLGDSLGDADVRNDTLADTLAEVGAVTLGDTLGNA